MLARLAPELAVRLGPLEPVPSVSATAPPEERLRLFDHLARWLRALAAPHGVLLLLEHPAVYTLGRRSQPSDLPMGEDWYRAQGIDVVRTDRGGKLTYHGPGQLVGYPIVKLAEPVDVVAYVRRLEQVLIDVCAGFGVAAVPVEGRSGAWLPADRQRPERKIAATPEYGVSRGIPGP